MAEEKRTKKTKKSVDGEKAVDQGETTPQKTVTEESVEKAAGQGEAAPERAATEETAEKEEETVVDATAASEGEQVAEEPERPAEEGKAESVPSPDELKKPLEKMTAKELREVAVGIPGISGVHAMKKEDLLAAMRKAWGIKEEKAPKKVEKEKAGVRVADLKAKIHEIKAKRAEAIQRKDKKMAKIYRRMISRLKKRTRRAA